MKLARFSPLLSACVLSASPVLAAESEDPFAALAATPPALSTRWQTDYRGMISLGLNRVSGDSFMFGQYNGLQEEGAVLTGDLRWSDWASNGGWSVTLRDLGLDTREGRLRWVPTQRLSLELGFDSQLQVRNDSGRTPFSGDAQLRLPASWSGGVVTGDFAALDGALRPLERELRRKAYFARLDFALSDTLTLTAGYRHQLREGRSEIGAGFYLDAASADATLLPFPIDYEDRTVDIGLALQTGALTLQTALEYATFDSADAALTWQNPYSNFAPFVRYPEGFGALAQPPDNSLLSGRVNGVWRLAQGWSLDFKGTLARAEQDEGLLPYSVNPVLAGVNALPVSSLDGSHETATGSATLHWRPRGRLSAELSVRGRDRDYDTDRFGFNYVRGDAGARQDPAFTVYNTAYDRRSLGGEGRVKLRLPLRSHLELAYGYERIERQNTAVDETEEDSYELLWRVRPWRSLSARLALDWRDVSAGTYEWAQSYYARLDAARINRTPDNQRFANHPLLTQFHLGNREELGAELQLNYLLGDTASLGGRLAWRDTDFDASYLGLRGREMWRLGLDASLHRSPQQQLTVYLNLDQFDSRQAGRSFRGGQEKNAFAELPPLPQASDPARDWFQDSEDRALVAGLSWEQALRHDFALQLDYSFSDTEARQSVSGSPLRGAVSDLPTVSTRTHQLLASALWTLQPALTLRLDYRYYRHDNDDYAWSAIGPAGLDKVLTFGQSNANESIHFLEASVVYHLR